MRDWLGLVRLGAQNGVRREMGHIVLFTAALQERGGGGWRKLVMEVGERVLCLRQQQSVTLSTGTHCFSFPVCFSLHTLTTVSRPPSFSFSCSLHDFPSLLSSACRHTLTCCMSSGGDPACHLSIYLMDLLMHIYWIVGSV